MVLCFFLLHELPGPHKRRVVDAALDPLAPGGRAVIADYARSPRWHLLRPVLHAVFGLPDPFAIGIWRGPVRSLSSAPDRFPRRERRIFGGLYQIVLAERPG